MILVTSAWGKNGRRTISALLKKNVDICALDISPETEKLKEIGVKETVVGDMADINVCRLAASKCDKIYFIPPLELEPVLLINMVNAAKQSGVKHFVFMSVLHTQKSSLPHHRAKGLGEEYLIDSDINFTIVNPTCYMYDLNVRQVAQDKIWECFWPQKTSWVHPDDVAEVVAKVLTEDSHGRASYELVGKDFMTGQEVLELFTKITGIKAEIKYPDIREVLAKMPDVSDYVKKTYYHLAASYSYLGSKGNPNILTWLLGREPKTFADFIHEEINKI